MGASYRQFCPVAKAMELLDERWTMLVVRELLAGSRHFNELRRGLPHMSPALLSRRLQQLVAAGIVIKEPDGQQTAYLLSPAGQELAPIINGIAVWGVRWVGELGDHELDPKLLMWDLHRLVRHSDVPAGRTVVGFDFTDVAPRIRHWWLVIDRQQADVCDRDPGFQVSVQVRTELRQMIRIWRGDVDWERARRAGMLEIDGPTALRRSLPEWFDLPAGRWVEAYRPKPTVVPAPLGQP